jgi:hypothetical protein
MRAGFQIDVVVPTYRRPEQLELMLALGANEIDAMPTQRSI